MTCARSACGRWPWCSWRRWSPCRWCCRSPPRRRTRKIKGMERLDMLPSQASPLLLFLGVTASGGNAVFLVDSTLDTAGEGRCKPSRSECAFLYLGAGSEHEFVNDEGDSYQLKVDEIRKVKVGEKPSAGASK